MSIRKITSDDVKAISELELCLFHIEAYTKDIISKFCMNNNGFVYILDDNIVAIALLIPEKKIISSFGVHPNYRKKGIATILMKHAIDFLKSPVYLYVRTTNIPALNLYKKLGFTINDTISDFYTKHTDLPGDAYHMVLITK